MSDIDKFYEGYKNDEQYHPYALKEISQFIPDKGCKILDVGCGSGSKSKHFKKNGNTVIGIDISKPQISQAKTVLDDAFIHNISNGLPFDDNEFDIIFSSAVLEHIFDYGSVLKEMHRILLPGGKAIIEVPNVNYWPNRLLMLFGRNLIWIGIGKHIRAFNKHNLKRSMANAGFKNVKIIGSILPVPKTNLKIHFPYLNRIFPGLSLTIFGIAEKH